MPSELLKNLMARAHESAVVLPDFQRDFVWKPSDVMKLLASLFNGYPIGGLLFMENTEGYAWRQLDGAPRADAQASAAGITNMVLVLDGQQRLTSCYRAFYGSLEAERHPGRYYFNYRSYSDLSDQDRQAVEGSNVENYIVYHPAKDVRRFFPDTAAEINAGLFPLDSVFQSPRGTDYSKWLSDFAFLKSGGQQTKFESLSRIQSEFIRRFIERITSYQVHFEEIRKGTNPDVICTVFETINTTGKRLTVFDLLVARCYPKDVKLREMLEAALERPLIGRFDPDGEALCVTALPRVISLFEKKQCRRADMLELTPSQMAKHWDAAVDALEKALRVLVRNFGCLGLRFVPLVDMIPPLAAILASDAFVGSDAQNRKLAKWYWRNVFASYLTSSTDTKTARTVREFGEWLSDDSKEPEAVKSFYYSSTLLDGVARIDSAVYRGVFTLLLASGVSDFGPKRVKIDQHNEETWSEIEDHHIYPKGFLAPYGIKGERANQILNRTPILKATNLAIKHEAPHVYCSASRIVGGQGLEDTTLGDHAISGDLLRKAFTPDVFDAFLGARQRELLKRVTRAVEAEPTAIE